MTSSLVGSEMCIRDSAWVTRPVVQHRLVVFLRYAPHPRKACHEFHAVSYTHLTLPTICSV
eukprot:8261248-Prorocentrum_lima.AAC.1